MPIKAIVIAGSSSGVGKTTIATGLMGALARRGQKVQPFKAGPDYIDPTYHTQVTGVPSRNLDTWMLSRPAVLELFNRAMRGKDIAVIEGVMGLYDGRSPVKDEGSTAELAKLLKAPVLLVVDSRKGARSLAALIKGFKMFDHALKLGGVILNGIGSETHLQVCREAIQHFTGLPVVGYLPRKEGFTLPERHLGLIPTVERNLNNDFVEQLIAQIEATFDIPTILNIAEQAACPETSPRLFPASPKPPITRISIARDKAFSFYYQDSLDLLAARGAELVSFSPLQDTALPPYTGGLYLGGGFPELYAADLAANTAIKQAIKTAAEQGMPVYAECGGLMYLGESITDFNDNTFNMAGILPVASRIGSRRLSLGYRTVQALSNGPLLGQGKTARGHEFHWSILEKGNHAPNAYRVIDKGDYLEGFQQHNILASYIHLHLCSQLAMAVRFISNCRKYQAKSGKKNR